MYDAKNILIYLKVLLFSDKQKVVATALLTALVLYGRLWMLPSNLLYLLLYAVLFYTMAYLLFPSASYAYASILTLLVGEYFHFLRSLDTNLQLAVLFLIFVTSIYLFEKFGKKQ